MPDPIDWNFVDKFYEFRKAKLPIESNLYEYLQAVHRKIRQIKERERRGKLNRRLRKDTMAFYNSQFSETRAFMEPIIATLPIPILYKARAMAIYDFRLNEKSTLRDLLSADVFGKQTFDRDFPDVEKLVGKAALSRAEKESNTSHFFLHRAQQSEFLFLHEIIVGHLVNSMSPHREILARRDLTVSSDYWAVSALAFAETCTYLGCSSKQVMGLHLADSAFIRKSLPKPIQTLLHVSAHLSWYVDAFNFTFAGGNPADNLVFLYSFFYLPALKRMAEGYALRPARRVARMIDEIFFEDLELSRRASGKNQIDMLRALNKLVDGALH